MAQSVERRIGSAEVTGPIPVSSLNDETAQSGRHSSGWAFFCASLFYLFGKISDLFDDIKTALRGCTCGEGQNTILGLRIKYDYFCYFFVRLYAIGYISRPEKN